MMKTDHERTKLLPVRVPFVGSIPSPSTLPLRWTSGPGPGAEYFAVYGKLHCVKVSCMANCTGGRSRAVFVGVPATNSTSNSFCRFDSIAFDTSSPLDLTWAANGTTRGKTSYYFFSFFFLTEGAGSLMRVPS